jgi:hypothetical protein
VCVAIADLSLQADIGERLAQLLKLRNGLGLVYGHVNIPFTYMPQLLLTRLGKAIANHIIDVQVRLERLRFRHDGRRACVVNQGVFEVVDFGGEAGEARNSRRALRC